MISEKLILRNAPLAMGEQVRVNHEGCTAGEDHRRRLYIKRTPSGLVAFCHNCSENGYVRDIQKKEKLSAWLRKAAPATPVVAKLPELTISSLYGTAWLKKHHIDPEECGAFKGIVGKPLQLALLLFDNNNNNIGYQIRNLEHNPNPKYVTCYITTGNGSSSWFNHRSSKILCITEDYLSAYRLFRDCKVNSLALLRTSLSDKTLRQIEEGGYEEIRVWLDPDLAGITGAKKVANKLRFFLPTTTKISNVSLNKEPKELTPKELEEFNWTIQS
jgi:hypothetical protein